tara:strand:- start:6843 stop:7304 length:462 start_codon:yes stop_codon:yes gene_type:complete
MLLLLIHILNLSNNGLIKQILILNRKMNKLKKDLQYLIIDPYKGTTIIYYVYVSYCIGNYLFSKFETKKDIILINVFDEFWGEEDGYTFESIRLKNPSYYDILVEANKSVIVTNDYHHTFLEGLNHIPNNKLFKYSGIRPNRNIEYYEFILGS